MDKLKDIGAKIREERKKLNFSQDELADRAKLHPTYISGIERGERNPTITSLDKIAKALNFPLFQLLKINNSPSVEDQILMNEFADFYKSLNPETKNVIKKIVKLWGDN